MPIIELTDSNHEDCVRQTVQAVRDGLLVLFPTDTVYGIGGMAFSQKVFNRLRKVKPERQAKPTAVLIDNIIRMSQIAGDVPGPRIVRLAEKYWPGPLTLVWKTSGVIPEEFQTTDRSLGFRVPKSPFLLDVLEQMEAPLWATSSNLPGQSPPRLFSEIKQEIIDVCDLIVKTRALLSGKASTVVDVRGRDPKIIRESSISEDEIRSTWKGA